MTCADNSPYNANTITFLLIIKLYANDIIVRIRAGPRDVVAGGALTAEVLNRAAKAASGGRGESMRGRLTPSQ